MTLFEYQKEGILQIEDYEGRVLLADEMGLGKSRQALEALKRNPSWFPALIVCPASVKYNWEWEAQRWIDIHPSVCETTSVPEFNRRGFENIPKLSIINYDILMHWLKYLKQYKLQTIIIDECHYAANPRTKRTKAVREICRGVPQTLALSGTPLTNRPSELWPTLNILWPSEFPSFGEFAEAHCNRRWTPWGWKCDGANDLKTLNRRLITLGMIRRKKEDVLKDLPPKIRRIVPCDLSDRDEYKHATTDFLGWLRKNYTYKSSNVRAHALVRIGYLLRLIARLKMKAVVEWCNRFFEETDEKLILFVVHHKATETLLRRVNAKSVVVNGQVTGRNRQLAVEQFQKDPKTRLFIGNIRAAGTGINLTAASEVGFVEYSWRPGDHTQAEDRPHRIGQDKHVFINYFTAGGTIEEDLCKILQKKQKVISEVLDGKPSDGDLNIYEELINILYGSLK